MRFVMQALICTIACRLSVGVRLIAWVRVIAGFRLVASTACAFVPARINAPTATRYDARLIAARSFCVRAVNSSEPGEASLYPTDKIDDETDNEDRAQSYIHEFLQLWVRVLIGSRPDGAVGTLAHAAREPAQRRSAAHASNRCGRFRPKTLTDASRRGETSIAQPALGAMPPMASVLLRKWHREPAGCRSHSGLRTPRPSP